MCASIEPEGGRGDRRGQPDHGRGEPEKIRGRRVLVVEDGPTLTHGGMKFGAGIVAAHKYGAVGDRRPAPVSGRGDRRDVPKYPEIGTLLPAMGYGEKQVADLEATINKTPCDLVVIGTPIDIRRIIKLNKPSVRVTYELQEIGWPNLAGRAWGVPRAALAPPRRGGRGGR